VRWTWSYSLVCREVCVVGAEIGGPAEGGGRVARAELLDGADGGGLVGRAKLLYAGDDGWLVGRAKLLYGEDGGWLVGGDNADHRPRCTRPRLCPALSPTDSNSASQP
jgi:hypothetical protein